MDKGTDPQERPTAIHPRTTRADKVRALVLVQALQAQSPWAVAMPRTMCSQRRLGAPLLPQMRVSAAMGLGGEGFQFQAARSKRFNRTVLRSTHSMPHQMPAFLCVV